MTMEERADTLADAAAATRDEHGHDVAEGVGAPGLPETDPIALTNAWIELAWKSEPNDAHAMTLATVDANGEPDARIVLLKGVEPSPPSGDGRGALVFFTNYYSAKGRQLSENPNAALLFHWKTLRRQIRFRGIVERISAADSDAYFHSRPYGSRIGAIASAQSQPLESRVALAQQVLQTGENYPKSPERPSHWGGFRLIPNDIEFWVNGAFRLHDRWRRRWIDGAWRVERLYP